MPKKYDNNLCSEIYASYQRGVRVSEICSEYQVPRSTVYYIIKKLKKNVVQPTQRDLIIIQQRLERQENINKINRDYEASSFYTVGDKIQFIQANLSNCSLTLLCEALKVSKTTYYTKTDKSHKTTFEVQREKMTPIVINVFNENKQSIGALKISKLLQAEGYHIAPKTVASIMHENCLYSVRGGAKKLYENYIKETKNKLNRQFSANRPNEYWVTDVTQFCYKKHTYYICSVLDLFSRAIVGWKIGRRNTTQLIKSTFLKAYESRKPSDTILLHSDRGANYTSKEYVKCLLSHGIIQSLSNPGTPYDNSVMESFFKTLKAEEIHRRIYHSEKEMIASISAYIEYYNNKRPHSYNSYVPPLEAEKIYYSKHSELY